MTKFQDLVRTIVQSWELYVRLRTSRFSLPIKEHCSRCRSAGKCEQA